MRKTQLAVIGGGPGGYTAAFYAADLGKKVTLIDSRGELGGVCLHQGCIPSKFYLHVAHFLKEAKRTKDWGIYFSDPQIDLFRLRRKKEEVCQRLAQGLRSLAKRRGIQLVQDRAVFSGENKLTLQKSREEWEFEHCIIATGSRPKRLPFLPPSPSLWTSREALELPFLPDRLLVIGGGAIGLELGSVYATLGSQVTLVELLEHLGGGLDSDLARILQRSLQFVFHKIHTNTKVKEASLKGEEYLVTLENGAKVWSEQFDAILVSVGREPNTDHLDLEKAKIQREKDGFIPVSESFQTENPYVYAIGDVVKGPLLAHRASHQAKVAVEHLLGHSSLWDARAVPFVIYTDPEVAWVGLQEKEAREQGIPITVFQHPWQTLGRMLTMDRTEGLTKIISHRETGQVLGIGMVGPHAGELIGEACLAVEIGALAEDLGKTIHPHPTLSETLMESAEGIFGFPTHWLKRRKE